MSQSNSGSSNSVVHNSHGHSKAAWISVGIMTVAFAVMTIATLQRSMGLFIVSAIGVAIGVVAWPMLSKMGMGEEGSH